MMLVPIYSYQLLNTIPFYDYTQFIYFFIWTFIYILFIYTFTIIMVDMYISVLTFLADVFFTIYI